MAIIRSRSVGDNPFRMPVPGLAESERQVAKRIEEARLEAVKAEQAMLDQRETEIAARAKQVDKDIKDGIEAHIGDWRAGLKAVQAAGKALNAMRDETMKAMERQMVEMALQLAGHIVHQKIEQDPLAMVPAMVQDFIASCTGDHHVEVLLHPRDLELCGDHLQDAIGEEHLSVTLRANGSLKRGSCRVRCGTTIAGGFYEQWERLSERLLAEAPANAEAAVGAAVDDANDL